MYYFFKNSKLFIKTKMQMQMLSLLKMKFVVAYKIKLNSSFLFH